MTLNQIAQQAMKYLDSVGVAADYDIKRVNPVKEVYILSVIVDDFYVFGVSSLRLEDAAPLFLQRIMNEYPQKSPA